MCKSKIIAEKIERITEILDELQYNEIDQFISIQKKQALIIKRIDKLQEYNELDDMNNAIVNKKLDEIIDRI